MEGTNVTPDYRDDHRAHDTHEREREVIVTNGHGSGTNYAGIVVAVLAIIVFGILGYLFIGALGDGGGGESPMPDDVEVDVNPGGGDAGGGEG